jgi:hypothetical protein
LLKHLYYAQNPSMSDMAWFRQPSPARINPLAIKHL